MCSCHHSALALAYYSILQYITVYYSIPLQYITVHHSISQYITVYHSILHLLKLHLVRLSVHAWFLEVFQCCFRITLGVGDSSRGRSHSSEGGEGQMDTLVRLPPIHICTCTNLTSSIHLHTFTLSHSHTITHTFHSSSSLLICEADIWRALACSLSEGIFTNQLRKQRSWISGCHCEGFLGRGREGGKEGGDERVEGEK